MIYHTSKDFSMDSELSEFSILKRDIKDFIDNPQLLSDYTEIELGWYFKKLIIDGNVEGIKSFLNFKFPEYDLGNGKSYNWKSENDTDSNYNHFLHLALQHNQKPVFKYLLNKKKCDTENLLDIFCTENNIEMIDFILNEHPPANINSRTDLFVAAMNNNFLEQFRLLVTHSKNPIATSSHTTLLEFACMSKKDDYVAVLIIDGNMQLSDTMKDWLNGNNTRKLIYPLPEKLVMLRELNQKLHSLPPKELQLSMTKEIKVKI